MLARLLFGYKMTQCLYVAAKLNIADHLSSGSKTISELAELTNTKPDPLYRVMRCLSALGMFSEETSGQFTLTTSAEDLRVDSANTMKDFVILCGEELYQSAGDLLYTVQTGKPAFDHIYGMTHWEYLDAHPDKARTFHDAMSVGTAPMIREIIKHFDFSSYKNIVDVGGGKGHLLCEILSQYPHANGTVYDLANANDIALEYIYQLDFTERCNFITGDFFNSVPAGDLHLLKVVLHDWDDEHAKAILLNCRKSILKTGSLLIIEKIIGDDKSNDLACLGDINMLVTQSGKERNLDEFTKILNCAGFSILRTINTSTVFSIIEAKPI